MTKWVSTACSVVNTRPHTHQLWLNLALTRVNNGGFFTKVNGPWIDAAVKQGADVFVVSNVKKIENIYTITNENNVVTTELTGFGKELHRLEWKHGYRFDPATRMMVPPSKANGLSPAKIAEQLKNVWGDFIEKYNLKLKTADFYEVCFQNRTIEIVLSFNKYFDEYTTFIVNRKDGSKHAVINILIKKNALGQKIMDENQIAESELFKDKMDRKFYSEKVLLSKFCDDILKGEFSVMN